MALLTITPTRRCYLAGRRIHHGLAGIALTTIGLLLLVHDRRDWPFPLVDR